jgi:hypothetical protein
VTIFLWEAVLSQLTENSLTVAAKLDPTVLIEISTVQDKPEIVWRRFILDLLLLYEYLSIIFLFSS